MSARRAQDATTFLLWICVQTHGPESKGLHLERGAQEAGNASARPGYPWERNGHDFILPFRIQYTWNTCASMQHTGNTAVFQTMIRGIFVSSRLVEGLEILQQCGWT